MSFFFERYKKINPNFKPIVPKKRWLRINNLKISESKLVFRLERKGIKLIKTELPGCYEYESKFSLSSTPEYLLGYFYLQNMASQSIAHIAAPKETDVVLDLAAAPGSKTTHLAQLMKNKGKIIAVDNDPQRLKKVQHNCERLGIINTITVAKDARYLKNIEADITLLDAPCSGNYCSEEGWAEKRNITGIQQNARLQKELLKTAYNLTKKDGLIIYSTCSLEPEEDEEIIEWALKNLKLRLEPIKLPIPITSGTTEKTKLTAKFWPYLTGTEGFFVAKLKKN